MDIVGTFDKRILGRTREARDNIWTGHFVIPNYKYPSWRTATMLLNSTSALVERELREENF